MKVSTIWSEEIRIIVPRIRTKEVRAGAGDANNSSMIRPDSWQTCQVSLSQHFQSKAMKIKPLIALKAKLASKQGSHLKERTQSLQLNLAIDKLSPKTTKLELEQRHLHVASSGARNFGPNGTSAAWAFLRSLIQISLMSASSISRISMVLKTRLYQNNHILLIKNCRWKRKSLITPKSELNSYQTLTMNRLSRITAWAPNQS